MRRPPSALFALLPALAALPPAAEADVTRYAVLFSKARVVEAADADGDGLTDDGEARYRCDPANPDTDGDGLADGEEVALHNTVPTMYDTDGDGARDGWEIAQGTDPLDPSSFPDDIDENGLPDAWERRHFGETGIDPEGDADCDGLSELEEWAYGADPHNADTDGDGMCDGNEIDFGHDPLTRPSRDFRITRIQLEDGTGYVRLTWNTMYGLGYMPQYSDDLTDGAWADLLRNPIWAYDQFPEGEASVLDTRAKGIDARFYRIVTVDE